MPIQCPFAEFLCRGFTRPPEGSKKVDPLIWDPILLWGTFKKPPIGIYFSDPSAGLGSAGVVSIWLQDLSRLCNVLGDSWDLVSKCSCRQIP